MQSSDSFYFNANSCQIQSDRINLKYHLLKIFSLRSTSRSPCSHRLDEDIIKNMRGKNKRTCVSIIDCQFESYLEVHCLHVQWIVTMTVGNIQVNIRNVFNFLFLYHETVIMMNETERIDCINMVRFLLIPIVPRSMNIDRFSSNLTRFKPRD